MASFVNATLTALSFGWRAVKDADSVATAGGGPDKLLIGMMRHTKTSSDLFACAVQAIRPYSGSKDREGIGETASFYVAIYQQHLKLNDAFLTMLRNLETLSARPSQLADTLSTIEVERDKAWKDVVTATTLTMMLLVDQKRVSDKGTLNSLMLTRPQHKALSKRLYEEFPELKIPVKATEGRLALLAASLYERLLTQPYRCSDEQ